MIYTKIDLPHLIVLPKIAYNKHEENPFHAVHFQMKAFDLCCFSVKHCSENFSIYHFHYKPTYSKVISSTASNTVFNSIIASLNPSP